MTDDEHKIKLDYINRTPDNFHCQPEHVRDDEIIARRAIIKRAYNYQYCSERLKHKVEIAELAIRRSAYNFEHLPSVLRDNYDIAEQAINKNPSNLSYCSERLRDDESLVLKAAFINSNALGSASDRIRNDFQILCKLLNKHIYVGSVLAGACKGLNANPSFVIAAIKATNDFITVYFWADETVQSNQSVILAMADSIVSCYRVRNRWAGSYGWQTDIFTHPILQYSIWLYNDSSKKQLNEAGRRNRWYAARQLIEKYGQLLNTLTDVIALCEVSSFDNNASVELPSFEFGELA